MFSYYLCIITAHDPWNHCFLITWIPFLLFYSYVNPDLVKCRILFWNFLLHYLLFFLLFEADIYIVLGNVFLSDPFVWLLSLIIPHRSTSHYLVTIKWRKYLCSETWYYSVLMNLSTKSDFWTNGFSTVSLYTKRISLSINKLAITELLNVLLYCMTLEHINNDMVSDIGLKLTRCYRYLCCKYKLVNTSEIESLSVC